MTLSRVMISDYGAHRIKIKTEDLVNPQNKELVRTAENCILSFAGIMPESSSYFFGEKQESEFVKVG